MYTVMLVSIEEKQRGKGREKEGEGRGRGREGEGGVKRRRQMKRLRFQGKTHKQVLRIIYQKVYIEWGRDGED